MINKDQDKMVRTKEQIESTKQKIGANLGKICEDFKLIQAEMNELPRELGCAYQELNPKTRESIVSSKEGFTANYLDPQGQRYHILIKKEF